jgi:hypothetical protein
VRGTSDAGASSAFRSAAARCAQTATDKAAADPAGATELFSVQQTAGSCGLSCAQGCAPRCFQEHPDCDSEYPQVGFAAVEWSSLHATSRTAAYGEVEAHGGSLSHGSEVLYRTECIVDADRSATSAFRCVLQRLCILRQGGFDPGPRAVCVRPTRSGTSFGAGNQQRGRRLGSTGGRVDILPHSGIRALLRSRRPTRFPPRSQFTGSCLTPLPFSQ